MPFENDPYRILGLPPDATLNEIRSAYRRLAKAYHPDAAGDRALQRFLAIQAAYERLVDGDGRLRRPGGSTAGGAGGGRATGGRGSTREPWRADASRARASREAWRARWNGGTGARSAAGAGADREAGPQAGAGGSRDPGRHGGRHPGGERYRRHTRRATTGSTTYDEAADTPLDPAWDGGAWYGPSSGTYWTLNPREYADPRKHGPEYQARARRDAGLAGDGVDAPSTASTGEPASGAAAQSTGPDRPVGPAARPPASAPAPDPGLIVRRRGPRSLLAFIRRSRPS